MDRQMFFETLYLNSLNYECESDPCSPVVTFQLCEAITQCAFFSLYQSFYLFGNKEFSITRINRMYYNATCTLTPETAIVFSFNYISAAGSGSYWGLAFFNIITGLYTYNAPLIPISQFPCEFIPTTTILPLLPIGVTYDFVQYVNNCNPTIKCA